MNRRGLLAAVTALWGACGDTSMPGGIELNLDRPVDVSFACYGKMRQTNGRPGKGMLSDPIITTAMPTAACEALSPPLTQIDDDPKHLDPMTGVAPIIPPTPVSGQEKLEAPDSNHDGVPDIDNPSPAWYGFILQSASGTVAVATWPAAPADSMAPANSPQQFSDFPPGLFKVLDADPLTPGKNAISIGEDPVAIVTDKMGCFEVTANAGSCDLSELDITSILGNIGSIARPRIDRVPVTTPNGTRILAKPSAMIAQPFLDGVDTVGNACQATATGQVYIAYPSCHLVAEVELSADASGPTAKVIAGIHYDDTTGAPSVLTGSALDNLCPTECAPGPKESFVPVMPGGVRPVAIDYKFDPRTDGFKVDKTSRLAIGADVGAVPGAKPLTVIDLDLTSFAPVPSSLMQIALEPDGGPVGVSALALTPQIGMGGNASPDGSGSVSDETLDQAQYVYAVATDGTVRVADVRTVNRECDTQIDGRFLRNSTLPLLGCLPVGQAGLPRRSGARSPGIELPGGAVANSVAIVKGLTAAPKFRDATTHTPPAKGPLTGAPAPGTLLGYFAMISASSGAVYVANVDDDYAPDESSVATGHVVGTSPVLVMPHQLRDGLSVRDELPRDSSNPQVVKCKLADGPGATSAGGPRIDAFPAQQSPAGTLRPDLDGQLPRLQQIRCISDSGNADPTDERTGDAFGPEGFPITTLQFGASENTRASVFPDLASVQTESWTLTYEGILAADNTINAVNGPTIRRGQAFVDRNGMFIEDPSRPFCGMGIEPGDIVDLLGCSQANGDSDCPVDYTCYVHPDSTVGACFLKTEAPRLREACRDFLISNRRYTVGTDSSGRTEAGKLVLLQRKHELSTTPIDGCVNDDQCDDLAHAALAINNKADPFIEPTKDDKGNVIINTKWSCMADPLRQPINDEPVRNKRCVQVCDPAPLDPKLPHPACANSMICAPDPTSVTGGVCMEGIEPPQVCLNGPQRYDVRAGEAFTVIGTRSGFVHPIVIDSDGSCKFDPNLAQDPLARGRIPLKAPACDPTADPITGLSSDGKTFEANPCSLTVPQVELHSTYSDAPAPPKFGACTYTVAPEPSSDNPVKYPLDVRTAVPAIKFRNRAMALTLVDPYRPAAQSCLGRDPFVDSKQEIPVPTNVPFVVTGYQIAFNVKAGFQPFTLLNGLSSPVKVVRGPTDSIWVVDDGDHQATGLDDVSTRGRVFRIESVPAFGTTSTLTNTLQ